MTRTARKTKDITGLIRAELLKLRAYDVDEAPVRIKLDAMENPFPLPDELRREIAEAVQATLMNRYPDHGAAKLKESIADFWGIGTQRMVLGNGSDELIQLIMLAFGGPALIPAPTFAMYEIISRALGQEVVTVPLGKNFSLDADKMLKKAKEARARVIFLACPNNPTGNRFADEAILKILNRSNAAVVIDEAYFSFSGKTFLPMLKDYPNMIILRTLSKIGLAGLRIGVLSASSNVIGHLSKIRLPYNINALSQAAAVVALRRKEVLNRQTSLLISARQRLYNALSQVQGITAYPSEANFILFKVPGEALSVYEKLKNSGILIRNLGGSGALRNCLRVTVGTPEENAEFVDVLTSNLEGK